jgi:hypothetical protein
MISVYSSCSKECGNTIEMRYLYEDEKNLIPYKGNEVLTFLHVNTNDTVTFIGEPKWKTYFNTSYSGADCAIETKREGRGIAFVSNIFNKSIFINQNIQTQGNSKFFIDFQNLNIESYSSWCNFNFDKKFDSIEIQKKVYHNVYFYSNDINENKPTDYGCYCTSKDGIIKMFFKTGETWELLNKR